MYMHMGVQNFMTFNLGGCKYLCHIHFVVKTTINSRFYYVILCNVTV